MARKASGTEQLEVAMERLKKAKTAAELRAAQAIVLPLSLGLSLEQTALAIGRSVGVTCRMRTRYDPATGEERKPRAANANYVTGPRPVWSRKPGFWMKC